jgi:hypothetical protein
MRKLALFAACLVFVGGCGVKTVKLRTFGFDSVAPESVVVHVGEPPAVPYDKYLLMQEESGDYDDIVEGFRRRAAACGMDAIIVSLPDKQLRDPDDAILRLWNPLGSGGKTTQMAGGKMTQMAGGKMNNLMATGIKYRRDEGVKK